MLAPRGPRQTPGAGRAAGASCIPGREGRCWVTPPRGWQAGKGGSQSPCAAAVAAVASFLQLMLFWAKLEANCSRGGELEPAAPPAAVRSPRSRWSDAPQAQAAGRHARPRARTRPHTAHAATHARGHDARLPRARRDRLGTIVVPALGLGNSSSPAWGCASLPTGMAMPRDSHLQVCRELLLLHQPGGRSNVASSSECCFAQLGRLFLRFLSHCKSQECPSVPSPCQKGCPAVVS